MPRSVFNSFAVDSATGAVVPDAVVTVNIAGGGLAQLYTSREGGTSLGNPYSVGGDGKIKFYANPGRYNIAVARPAGGSVFAVFEDVLLVNDRATGPVSAFVMAEDFTRNVPWISWADEGDQVELQIDEAALGDALEGLLTFPARDSGMLVENGRLLGRRGTDGISVDGAVEEIFVDDGLELTPGGVLGLHPTQSWQTLEGYSVNAGAALAINDTMVVGATHNPGNIRTALGASATGDAVFTGTPAQALTALNIGSGHTYVTLTPNSVIGSGRIRFKREGSRVYWEAQIVADDVNDGFGLNIIPSGMFPPINMGYTSPQPSDTGSMNLQFTSDGHLIYWFRGGTDTFTASGHWDLEAWPT